MSIDRIEPTAKEQLTTQEHQLFDAAAREDGFDFGTLLRQIPVKEWEATMQHLTEHTAQLPGDIYSNPETHLTFEAHHPLIKDAQGQPTYSKNEQGAWTFSTNPDKMDIRVGLIPSGGIIDAEADLKTGKYKMHVEELGGNGQGKFFHASN